MSFWRVICGVDVLYALLLSLGEKRAGNSGILKNGGKALFDQNRKANRKNRLKKRTGIRDSGGIPADFPFKRTQTKLVTPTIFLLVQGIFTDVKNSGLKNGVFRKSFELIPSLCTYVGCTGLSRVFSNWPKWQEPQKLRETKLIGRQVGSDPG
jgi:hypothetical protein